MRRATAQIPVLAAALLLGACASQTAGLSPTVSPTAMSSASPAPATTAAIAPAGEAVSRLPSPSTGGYQMTADDLSLDCKKLTGRMAIRIVQIRDFQNRNQASGLARGIQTAWKPANGGRGEGADPDGRYAKDRAKLEAYNQRLAEKNCPNFDLTAELAPGAKEPPRTRKLNKS